MTRDEAFNHVKSVMDALPLDANQYDALRRAVVEYGHAAATETLDQCKQVIADCLT